MIIQVRGEGEKEEGESEREGREIEE